MFKIGEFSRFTRVSVKMLRRYDEMGLLAPSWVEPSSGYRYYQADQLPRLNRIIALKDLGFSLEEVAELLHKGDASGRREALFGERKDALERSIERDSARLRQLEALASGRWPDLGRYDVVLRAVPPGPMATLRRRVASLGDAIAELFERLEACAARRRVRAPNSPILLFHDEEYRERDLDVEAAVPLARAIAGSIGESGDIQVREVEGCPTMACAIYRGGYEQMSRVLQAILLWTELHHMCIAGPIREVYLRFGAAEDGYRLPSGFLAEAASEFVTEVQVPVAREVGRGHLGRGELPREGG